MGAGIFNLFIGVLSIIAGLSGRFTFIGTQSTELLVAVGAGIAGLGLFQIVKSRAR